MATQHEHGDDLDGEGLDDAALERALDGAFAAAADEAGDGDAGVAASVLQELSALTGEIPMVSLRDVDRAGETPMLKPLGPDDAGNAGFTGDAGIAGKYVIHGLLGRGGVGMVHRGHDRDLGRDVAIKFLQAKFQDRPAVLHRFVEEAQIGGQLQHPGIVPVYELGMSKGRPFFAMKLVKGQTLAKRLAERASPATDRRTFLSIFEDVCQTMAYAHARGVVHRDLKPANIMIGSFGEVQVVDWGMGKVLPQGGVDDERRATELRAPLSVIETVRSSGHGSQSTLGTVMGTPAYMPPEQARGDVDRMDERSDVFALGAILCEVLTAEPPYVGGDQNELLGMAAMAKLDDARERLAACGAESDLVELAERCLLPAPAARPRSAEVVARTVHDHLAAAEARVHEARVAAAEANVRAASLKRTQRLGIALTTAIGLGLAASLWFWRDAVEAQVKEATARSAAERNLANFNRLSHVVRLETAKAKEKKFYPAWPDQAPAMRAWLDKDAADLRNALPELLATLVALEVRALTQTEAEKDEARRSHPRAAEIATLRQKLAMLRRAQTIRSDSTQPEPHRFNEAKLPKTSRLLYELAWPLVTPERQVFGREAEALALARRAVALAPATGDERAIMLDTLAWALFANGLDDEALERSRDALATIGEDQRGRYEFFLRELEKKVLAASGPEGQASIDQLAAEVVELEAVVEQRQDFRFTDDADQFLHATLRALVADVEAFVLTDVPDVAQRHVWAARVDDLTIARYRGRWNEARLAILRADGVTASKRYAEVPTELAPQTGLVPIGMNPRSKLWEFYHARSGWDPEQESDPAEVQVPEHDVDGRLDVTGRGIVFVLIPGGEFIMGAQSEDENEPNHDPAAETDEGPVREIELAPFFLSKYELTQGQWARLSGGDYPSWHRLGESSYPGIPVPIGDDHPVEQVSWEMCDELLKHHGLAIPTEAQWERGCRAGTSTPWCTGKTPGSLEGHANVLDQTGQNAGPEWPGGESFDDKFKGPAPVGTYDPNGFGLHDVHGNVSEWCRDKYSVEGYTVMPRDGDGLRGVPISSSVLLTHVERGGNVGSPARLVRAADRTSHAPGFRFGFVGVRPVRKVQALTDSR